MAQRNISRAQIAQTLAGPDRTEADREDPELRHAIKRYGTLFLRVVYNYLAHPHHVVTAFFDRRLRRKR